MLRGRTMRNTIRAIFILFTGISLMIPLKGQSLQETLEMMARENAKGYLGPVVTAFGTGVNSGTFRKAKPHGMLGFDVTLNVSATVIPDAGLEYEFFIPGEITLPFDPGNGTTYDIVLDGDQLYPGDRTSSTFFGEAKSNTIEAAGSYAVNAIKDQLVNTYGVSQVIVDNIPASDLEGAVSELNIKTPKGFNFPGLPMFIPQASVGLPMDIEITLRGFPNLDLGNAGELSFYGFGGKIGLNQFIPIPLFPVALSAGYYVTGLKLGDVIESNHSIMTLQASKSIPFITVYGGIGIENSSMDVTYEHPDLGKIEFSLDGKNKFRTIAGVRLKLALLSINADYNVGEYKALNIGVGLTLR